MPSLKKGVPIFLEIFLSVVLFLKLPMTTSLFYESRGGTSDFRLPTSKFKASIFGVPLISPEMESNLIQLESYKLLFLRIVA